MILATRIRGTELPASGAGERRSLTTAVRVVWRERLMVVALAFAVGAMVEGGIETWGVLSLHERVGSGIVLGAGRSSRRLCGRDHRSRDSWPARRVPWRGHRRRFGCDTRRRWTRRTRRRQPTRRRRGRSRTRRGRHLDVLAVAPRPREQWFPSSRRRDRWCHVGRLSRLRRRPVAGRLGRRRRGAPRRTTGARGGRARGRPSRRAPPRRVISE